MLSFKLHISEVENFTTTILKKKKNKPQINKGIIMITCVENGYSSVCNRKVPCIKQNIPKLQNLLIILRIHPKQTNFLS